MKRQVIIIACEYDDSLYPDEGALLKEIDNALHSRRSWFYPDKPGVFTMTIGSGVVIASNPSEAA